MLAVSALYEVFKRVSWARADGALNGINRIKQVKAMLELTLIFIEFS
jgi:hypothetical protein